MKLNNILKINLPVILLIMSTLVISKIFLPGKVGTLYSYIKDVLFLLLFFISLFSILSRASIRIDSVAFLALLYTVICLFYTAISPVGTIAFKGLIQMVYGPLLYFIIYNLKINHHLLKKIMKISLVMFSIFTFLGLVIFFIIGQERYYTLINLKRYYLSEGLDFNSVFLGLFRYSRSFVRTPRLSGILISPTEVTCMAAFVISLSYAIVKKKAFHYFNIIMSIIVMYLSASRSIMTGYLISILMCKILFLKKKLIIIYMISFAVLSISSVLLMISKIDLITRYVDGSTAIHLYDLLIRGPAYAITNFKGLGVGMSGLLATQIAAEKLKFERIHIESEYLMAIIQIGIWGLGVYLYMIYSLVQKMRAICKDEFVENSLKKIAISNISIILTLHIAAITFPILGSRILVTFTWILSALIANSYRTKKMEYSSVNYSYMDAGIQYN